MGLPFLRSSICCNGFQAGLCNLACTRADSKSSKKRRLPVPKLQKEHREDYWVAAQAAAKFAPPALQALVADRRRNSDGYFLAT